MKKIYIILLIAGLLMVSQSIFVDPLLAKVSDTKTNLNMPTYYDYLISGEWKLKEIEVAGNSYIDPETTNLEFHFLPNGTLDVKTDTIGSVPWEFSTVVPQGLVLSKGTNEEQLFNIKHLDYNYFIYDANYVVEDVSYTYIFKFVKKDL